MEKEPFPGLKISDTSFLDEVEERAICPKCSRKKKYFCPSCCIPIGGIDDKIPNVKLSVKIDIIKHKNERDGKSTAVHAALLSPQDISIYTYPDIPHYEDLSQVILVFPGKNSVHLSSLIDSSHTHRDSNTDSNNESSRGESQSSPRETDEDDLCGPKSKKVKSDVINKEDNHAHKSVTAAAQKFLTVPFTTVVFIDSTWDQCHQIVTDDRLKGIKTVFINDRTTKFWRPQTGKPDSYLATIEAIYYFMRDLHELTSDSPYNGEYDDLLFFFVFLYRKISNLIKNGKYTKLFRT